MKTLLKLILFIITIAACSNKQTRDIARNDLGGITKRITNRLTQSASDSIFDSLGNIREVVDFYYDGRLQKKKVSYYKNNLQDSTMLEYHKSGKLKSRRFYYAGKECFERVDFTENEELSKYIFLDSDQRRFYIRLYDSTGRCVGERGAPFFESFVYSNANFVFSTTDTVTAFFYAPNPPDCDVKLYTIHEGSEINNIKPLNEKFIYRVKIYPLRRGDFEWQVKMKIFDKKNGSIIYSSDPTTITYKVK